jgi:hypothetical protein
MLDEHDMRQKKSTLLTHIEYRNSEIAKNLKIIEEWRKEIHDCEVKLQTLNEVLED